MWRGTEIFGEEDAKDRGAGIDTDGTEHAKKHLSVSPVLPLASPRDPVGMLFA